RPFHTIIPAFMTRDAKPVMSFGVMGADMQPQGHVQMTARTLDYKQNPQAAADGPRWKIAKNGDILLEASVSSQVAEGLRARGHRVVVTEPGSMEYGSAQLIRKVDNGYVAGSEPRRDGQAAGF
ncbi:MAG: gamma-glutamyltransferase, partial [Betaproteobacteria bacterium]|nr:gamma-glutamyltransferase [Betaproteobacteria bacterium]